MEGNTWKEAVIHTMGYDKAFQMELYRRMVRQREFEDAVTQLCMGGFITAAHLCRGQEAIAAGISMLLRDDDFVLPSHRGHGQILTKGADTKRMMAELLGKGTGYCKGKGGSMHLSDMEHNVFGSIGIVGCNLSLAVGAGLACKLNHTGQVAVCYFGDGASNRGTFHESMNFASIRDLPIIYALENNFYAISEDIREMTNVEKLSVRAVGYGIPGETVDGNDPCAVYEAAKVAIERARNAEGPTLLEFRTWRHHGHYEGDPDLKQFIFRDRAEHEAWLKRDPIVNTRAKLLAEGTATEAELAEIERAAKQEIEEAVEFAHESPWPDPSELMADVYAK